jgi:hypothetical protein
LLNQIKVVKGRRAKGPIVAQRRWIVKRRETQWWKGLLNERRAQYKCQLGADVGIVPQISADVGEALIGQQCSFIRDKQQSKPAWEEETRPSHEAQRGRAKVPSSRLPRMEIPFAVVQFRRPPLR